MPSPFKRSLTCAITFQTQSTVCHHISNAVYCVPSQSTCNTTTHLVFCKVRCKLRTTFVVFHSLLKSCHDPVQQEGRSFRNNHLHTSNTLLLEREGHRSTFLERCDSCTGVRPSWRRLCKSGRFLWTQTNDVIQTPLGTAMYCLCTSGCLIAESKFT